MLTYLDIAQSTDVLTVLEQQITERLLPLQELGLGILNSPTQPVARMWGHCLIYFTDLSNVQSRADKSVFTASASFTIAVKIEEMRTHQTSYPFLSEIIKLMQGFIPKGLPTSRFQLQSINYNPSVEGEGLAWTYDSVYSIGISQNIKII